MAKTIEEAIKIYKNQPDDRIDRYAGLKDGYIRDVEDDVVRADNREVCEHEMKWFDDGKLLLCIHCFVDGT